MKRKILLFLATLSVLHVGANGTYVANPNDSAGGDYSSQTDMGASMEARMQAEILQEVEASLKND